MSGIDTKIKLSIKMKILGSSTFYLEEQRPGVAKIYHSIFLRVLNTIMETSEATAEFSIARFIRAFIYHIMFFYCGPFMVPVILIWDKLGLAANMGFWWTTSIRS